MKKLTFVSLVILFNFLLATNSTSEKTAQVFLRYGTHDSNIKIVLESEEEVIKNLNVISSSTSVRIEFPVQFEIKKPKDFIFETIKKDKTLIIKLNDISSVRTYRLVSPARFVIDGKTVLNRATGEDQKRTEKTTDQAETKRQSDVVNHPQQKSLQDNVPSTEKSLKILNVVIDPGHGGYDYGIITMELKEKDINLDMSKDLASVMMKKGQKVFLTRRADQSLSIWERINFAINKKPDLFLSIHSSLSDKFNIYIFSSDEIAMDAAIKPYSLSVRQERYTEKSRKIARMISEVIKNELNRSSTIREMNLPVLGSIDAPAVLIECPLMKIADYDRKNREKIAGAILKGISLYE